jgi:hydrogenase nickel incorporation protein HypB
MCVTCGCGRFEHETGDGQHHHHDHSPHDHTHGAHDHDQVHAVGGGHEAPAAGEARASRILRLERSILDENDRLAERNRGWFAARRIAALNLMGAPGAGKTALLERTVVELGARSGQTGATMVSVIEGDQATRRDADRIARTGCRVAQINTGAGCHLDARMVAGVLESLAPPERSLLVVENVGNLVCPALFDLGEQARVVVLSVAEGDDKPEKYPHMFRAADVLVLNKLDLLPHVDFDLDRCVTSARMVNPGLRVFPLSARDGEGVAIWCNWLRDELARAAQTVA